MTEKKPPRRPEFDEICNGWGSDNRADLQARIDLAKEWMDANGLRGGERQAVGAVPTAAAEFKVLRAMEARMVGFMIAAGELAS